jgi:ribosomal protein S18 acetylase RimI-like enzyme
LSLKKNVHYFQELTNNAWPAKCFFFLNGWILRFSDGVFDRANSVLPLQYFGSNIKNDIQRTEKIYQNKGLDVIFQIPEFTMPLDLDKHLECKGYRIKSPTTVMRLGTNSLHNLELPYNYHFSVISSDINEEWLKAINQFSKQSQRRAQLQESIIRRITIPKKYFYFFKSNKNIIGLTLGVFEKGTLGIYSFVVDPMFRRNGIGTALISYIISWCQEREINTIYLQVEKDNYPALKLYEKIGFQSIYDYHYRIKEVHRKL